MEENQNNNPEGGNTGPAEGGGFSVPQEYANRGWTEKIQSYDDLFKAYDNSQTLLGKRPAGIPANDAPQEEWDKFYKAWGRPDDPAAYELSTEVEGLPDDMDLSPYEEKAKSIAHELGLSPAQANKLWNRYVALELEATQEHKKSLETKSSDLDKRYDSLRDELFKDNFDDVFTQTQSYLLKSLPDNIKQAMTQVEDMPEVQMAFMKIVTDTRNEIAEIKKKYGAEDKLASGVQTQGLSMRQLLDKMNEVRDSMKTMQPSPRREEAERELERLRSQLSRLAK